MKVLVTGGTGFVGRHLCRELSGRGHDIVATSRNPDPSVVPDGVELREADVREFGDLDEAIAGVDAVVHLVALSPLFRPRGGESLHERVHVQGTRNLLRAMEAAGIDRLVHMSGIAADPDGPTAYLRAKGRAEGIVRSSDVGATIFRPTVIFGEADEFISFVKLVTTPYVTGLPGGGRSPFQPIWVGDVVAMMADALEEDDHVGETYEIGGPAVYTLAELTEMVYGAEGRWVKVVPVPMPLAGLALTVAGPLPFVPFGRDQYRGLQVEQTVESNNIDAFGQQPAALRSFADYLEDDAGEVAAGG